MKLDDSSLTPAQYKRIQKEAKLALERAGAIGHYPTPVSAILSSAKLKISSDDVLKESFLTKIRHKAGDALKRAMSKVWGLFHAQEGMIYIDRTVLAVKQTFLKLHETAHALLPWQKSIYSVVEDCEKTLAPDVSDLFDREANVFASEVLFQLENFSEEAAGFNFGINVPVDLSKKYGASIYATIRRYVSKNNKTCAVLVLNKPELQEGDGFKASLRRLVMSPSFEQKFGKTVWPECYTPDDKIGAMVPIGKRRMSGQRSIQIKDSNGTDHECVAEAFTNSYQVFILMHVTEALSKKSVLVTTRNF